MALQHRVAGGSFERYACNGVVAIVKDNGESWAALKQRLLLQRSIRLTESIT